MLVRRYCYFCLLFFLFFSFLFPFLLSLYLPLPRFVSHGLLVSFPLSVYLTVCLGRDGKVFTGEHSGLLGLWFGVQRAKNLGIKKCWSLWTHICKYKYFYTDIGLFKIYIKIIWKLDVFFNLNNCFKVRLSRTTSYLNIQFLTIINMSY